MQARVPGRVLAAVAATMLVAAGGADGGQRWIRGLPVVLSDDGRIEGARRDGRPHGHGVLSSPSFGYRYEGGLRDGLPHGHGFKEGEWRWGELYEGEGVITYLDGDRYEEEGVFADGDRYEGEWRHGRHHGRGIGTSPDGGRYEGEWRWGRWHGQGVHTSPDGTRYAGELVDGERHGYGVRTTPGGVRAAGMFYKGRFIGRCSRDGRGSGAGGPLPSGSPL